MSILKEEVGEVISAADVTGQSAAAYLPYGYIPFALMENLFNAIIKDMRYENVDLSKLSTEVPFRTGIDALKNCFVFRLVDVIDETAQINISKQLPPKKAQLNVERYINNFCNKHFKYRKTQLDCEYLLQAVSSELAIFAESNNLKAKFDYESTITLRAASRRVSYYSNELVALKFIKKLFLDQFNTISDLLYELECLAYRLRGTPIVNNTTADFDIEL